MAKRTKTHVKKNDEVVVISGNHKGESGRVLQVFPGERSRSCRGSAHD